MYNKSTCTSRLQDKLSCRQGAYGKLHVFHIGL